MFPQYVFGDVSGRKPKILKYFILIHDSPNVILVFWITECGTLEIYSFAIFEQLFVKGLCLIFKMSLAASFLPFLYPHDSRILHFYFGNVSTLGLSLSINTLLLVT